MLSMPDQETYGEVRLRVSELVDQRELSIQEFAERAGIAYGTALGLYRGATTRIDLETLAGVCHALSVSPGDIFDHRYPTVEAA